MARRFASLAWALTASTVACGPPATDPNCHWDCFGFTECQNGEVIEWINAPISCDEWQGQCPHWPIHTCTQGCAVDPSRIDEAMVAAEVLCEETPNKQAGDSCPTARDSGCLPSRATINPDQTVTNHYLQCDSTTHTCVLAEPPLVSGWLNACDSEVDAFVGSGLSGFFFGSSCSVCVFADDATAGCLRSGCSLRCNGDQECPLGALCRDDIVNRDADYPNERTGVCVPGAPGNLADLPCR